MKIVSCDKLRIDGRGQVFVAKPDDNPGVDLLKLTGQTVEIEDTTWLVVGVESFMCALIPGSRLPVGILVRPSEKTP